MNLPAGRLTNILVIVTAATWLALDLSGWLGWASVMAGFIPARVTGPELDGALPVLLTPFSAAFIHANLAHIGFNMLMLLYCGRYTEYALGPGGFACLYIVGAYASAGAQYLVDPASTVPMVGASGATSAVIGAYALLFGQKRAKAIGPIPAIVVHIMWLAAAWIGVQLLFGIAMADAGMAIAVAAHVGGFIAGLLLARPLLLWRYRRA
ncbi:rhomboid family intramembrane serine protease [Sphingomonas colocasiae]|uniref:Rhomboid family intramembrane serine protease n=1 Tax=Sphingomonas colocasiae TaxID=1848973 RepID=A0ABS7PKR3_9SPHN|nr:rhomboid family intramembrane serine protease [Sphingomonas colocasiae]MBY8820679.1 rhomboid family intramembrane serine protease [Sphingomonas colocasiae]